MIIRTLAADEYPRLKDVADGYVPDAKTSIVVVAEEDGEIKARMILLTMVHLEGTWIADDKRGTTLVARMVKQTLKEADKAGLKGLLAYTESERDDLSGYMERLEFSRVPVLVWSKDIKCH